MVRVFKFGYVMFDVQNMDAMQRHYSDVLGLTLVEQESDGSAYLSTSVDHHNVVLARNNRSGLRAIGLQLAAGQSLADAQKYLNDIGLKTEMKSDSQPGVPQQLEFERDGYAVHLYTEMKEVGVGFKRSGVAPNKVGHISVRSEDAKASVDLYRHLGFKNTDWIEDYFAFMTCNTDHHVLNFVTSEKRGMHHVAMELRGYSHMIQSLDWLGRNEVEVLWGPSRHGAGHNIATYHVDPEGNMIELFCDLDVYIADLDQFDPRPWHESFPQKPMVWDTDACITRWGTVFGKSLV